MGIIDKLLNETSRTDDDKNFDEAGDIRGYLVSKGFTHAGGGEWHHRASGLSAHVMAGEGDKGKGVRAHRVEFSKKVDFLPGTHRDVLGDHLKLHGI